MRTRVAGTLVAAMLTAPALVAVTATSAEAGPRHYYSACDKLHKKFDHGVAKSKRAGNKQVRDGYGRPASGDLARKVYAENKSRLDRDNDGTACEA